MKTLPFITFIVLTVLTPFSLTFRWVTLKSNVPTTGITTRVSVASDGTQGSGASEHPVISSDGRYVAFSSIANNLVPTDTDWLVDVFVHDQQTHQTSLVSVSSDATKGNSNSYNPDISADGRYVGFESDAYNLVPGDSNGDRDIFVHDQQTGQTILVSMASNGTQGNSDSYYPSISGDGRYVAFISWASNLVPGDVNGWHDVFVHDQQTGQTALVSMASDGTQGNNGSSLPFISADGRYVAFISGANNLVPDDTNNDSDVFLRDLQTGLTSLTSVASDGTQGNDTSWPSAISADGRYVVISSSADNLIPGDTNDTVDVFVHDQQTGQNTLVSVASDGTQGNSQSGYNYSISAISADGRYVAFFSSASNLVLGDTNNADDIFVHDRETGQTTRASVASDGTQGDISSYIPTITADGRYVAFDSYASNLVQDDTNENVDIFVHDLGTWIDSYTVSGQVTDIDGNPIIDVSVSTTSGSTTTDANGNYIFTGLITGTYTLTPTKPGYSFTPPSRTVLVPPEAVGQNFVGTISGDMDGDGLPDLWEIYGYDQNGDGIIDVNLPAMGADPNHTDIFVEVDYMVEKQCFGIFCITRHSHKPNPDSISLIVEAFNNAPVFNPDNIQGINLHVDFGPETPMNSNSNWGSLSHSNSLSHIEDLNWNEFNALKQTNFDFARNGVFHYAIFAHHYEDLLIGPTCASGVSLSTPAWDFIVSLGGFGSSNADCRNVIGKNYVGTMQQQAGAFMHELGHNLGLQHGGGDGINGKPNYLSVMNYSFTLDGLIFNDNYGGTFDYSRSDQIPPLIESQLNETVGLNGGSSTSDFGTIWSCPNGQWNKTLEANSPLDWNCNGSSNDASISANINHLPPLYSSPPNETLNSYFDWNCLIYNGNSSGCGSLDTFQIAEGTMPADITLDEYTLLPHPFNVGLASPGGITAFPGFTSVYTLTIINSGENDDLYTLNATSSLGWVDLSSIPVTISLTTGEANTIILDVALPPTATADEVDIFKITITSSGNPALWTSAYITTRLMDRVFIPIVIR